MEVFVRSRFRVIVPVIVALAFVSPGASAVGAGEDEADR